jgi:hypothetical protein
VPVPTTSAAVDQVLAVTQSPATTVAERHTRLTGIPLPGSRMVVHIPARPDPGGPAMAMSPPRRTSTPTPGTSVTTAAHRSAAHALAIEPRSSRTPRGSSTVRACSSSSIPRGPP